MKQNNFTQRFLPPAALGVILLAVYFRTMAPGLTWANNGSDGGDLIAAAAVGGVPHPTGYPLYLILARVFQSIPLGTLAYRTNVLSVVCMTLASILLYMLVTHYLYMQGRSQPQLAGLASGFFFGLAPLVWSQAVITEVYALHVVFVCFLLLLFISPITYPFLFRLRGLFLGLALANHITSLLLLPILFFDIWVDKSSSLHEKWKELRIQILWMFLGLTPYLILPFRAASYPPVNWGNPQTLNGLFWLVSGQLYRDQLFISLSSLPARITSLIGILMENIGLPGMFLSLLGLIYFFKRSRFHAYTLWIAFAFSAFALQYRTVDSDLYLIPVLLCFSAWIGVGLDGVFQPLSQRFASIKIIASMLVMAYVGMAAVQTLPVVDASKDIRAEEFAGRVLSQAPARALLFIQGDRAVFSMWYFHYALNERPDLFIIASDLLHFPWYLDTLRATYPQLELSEPFPWTQTIIEANPQLPVCYINDTQIDCEYP